MWTKTLSEIQMSVMRETHTEADTDWPRGIGMRGLLQGTVGRIFNSTFLSRLAHWKNGGKSTSLNFSLIDVFCMFKSSKLGARHFFARVGWLRRMWGGVWKLLSLILGSFFPKLCFHEKPNEHIRGVLWGVFFCEIYFREFSRC